MKKRKNQVLFRLDDKELAHLLSQVKRSGLSKEAYIRSVIMEYRIKELPPVEFFEVLKNLRQINNNMNQIAVRANSLGMIDAVEYRRNVEWLQQVVGNMIEEVYK